MKKLFIGMICLISCLTLNSLFVSAEEVVMNQKFVNLAKEVVENHVESVDTGAEHISNANVVSAVDIYLKNKEQAAVRDIEIYNYNVQTSVVNYCRTDSVTCLDINVKASWNYVEDIDSGYGKNIKVVIDNATGKVVDIYDVSSDFDIIIRGNKLDVMSSDNRLTEEVAKASSKIYANKMAEVEKQIEKSIEEDKANLSSKLMARGTNAYSWIYHDDVVAWARANYYKDQPSSGGSGVSYIDFYMPEIYSYDCTNFVSHALLAGSARVYDTGGYGISSTGWYCRNMDNRSSSWTGVTNLYSFVINNTTKGPGGYSMTWNYDYEAWSPGDIMQFHDGDGWGHSCVITGSVNTSNGLVPLVTGRTGDGWNNNNQTATSVCGSNAKRILHLYNYGA